MQEFFMDATRQVRLSPSSLLTQARRSAYRLIRTRRILHLPKRRSRPPNVAPELCRTRSVDHVTAVGSQFRKVMRAGVALEPADARLAIASTGSDVTLFIE